MDWLDVAPSAPWQWIGLVGGLVALGLAVVTLPTVFQMIWGRPEVAVDFNTVADSDGVRLQCIIRNKPIGRWLRLLRVVRSPATITADMSISEAGSGAILHEREMLPMQHGIDGDGGKGARVAELTATWPLLTVPVVWHDGAAYFIKSKVGVRLNAGVYLARLTISHEHGKCVFIKRLNVGRSSDELYWKD